MDRNETSSLILLMALVVSLSFITHSLSTRLTSALSPVLWLGNGIALHFAIKEFLFPTSRQTQTKEHQTQKSTPTKKKKKLAVDTSLDTSQGQTKLQRFRFKLPHSFDFVNERVSSRLPYLAGSDLKTLKSLKSEPIGSSKGRFFLRKYVFSLDDVPSVIRSALGTDVMEIEERCVVYEGKKRISRFENTSLTNLFRVVVIETYSASSENVTMFDVTGTMHITGLVWPASTFASSFAAQNYTPKLKEKLERIMTVLGSKEEGKPE